jgi:hypothetical protein
MARLFVGPREMNFISDITKELIKDIVGQAVYMYPISELRTQTHDIYNEAIQKVFDAPIKIEALVSSPESETKTDGFGVDRNYKLEVYFQYRDLLDKKINVCVGDFFSYGSVMYEISKVKAMRNIYGQPENKDGIHVEAINARESNFKVPFIHGPTDRKYSDTDAVPDTFVQQRGFEENSQGKTGDKRDLIENGVLELPSDGPREVSPKGDETGSGSPHSAFYDDES